MLNNTHTHQICTNSRVVSPAQHRSCAPYLCSVSLLDISSTQVMDRTTRHALLALMCPDLSHILYFVCVYMYGISLCHYFFSSQVGCTHACCANSIRCWDCRVKLTRFETLGTGLHHCHCSSCSPLRRDLGRRCVPLAQVNRTGIPVRTGSRCHRPKSSLRRRVQHGQWSWRGWQRC